MENKTTEPGEQPSPQTTQNKVVQPSVQTDHENNQSKWKINWVEILVVGIVLATLGWLAVTVFNMNGTLAKVEVQANESKDDIARIRGVLPDLGKAIAQSEVQAPINAALVVSKPFKDEKGTLVKTFKVIDTKESKLSTYTVKLQDENDVEKTLLVNGSIHLNETRPVSFSKLIGYSNQIGQTVTLSSSIDLGNSFVINNLDSLQYSNLFNKYLGQPKTVAININADNWSELSSEIKKNKQWTKSQ
jgi:hypothetical protein